MEKMRRGRKRKRRDWTLPLPFCKNSCGHSCGPGWYELSVKELKIPVLSAVTLKRAGLSRRHSHIYKACAPPRTTFPFRKVSPARVSFLRSQNGTRAFFFDSRPTTPRRPLVDRGRASINTR